MVRELRICDAAIPPHPISALPGRGAAYDPTGDTKYLGVTYQDFFRGDSRLLSSLSSSTIPALSLGTSECDLKTVHRVKREYAPRAHAPLLIDDDVGVVACHNASDKGQGPPNVCETCQVINPPEGEYSIAWSALSAIPSISYERLAGIGGASNNTYVHDAKVPLPVQDQLVVPRTISNADRHLPKQSSYSELSQALGEPAPTLMHPRTPSSMENPATGAWSTVPSNPHNKFYAHSSSSALVGHAHALRAQGLIVDHTPLGTNTHLWSQSAYAPPHCSFNTWPPISDPLPPP